MIIRAKLDVELQAGGLSTTVAYNMEGYNPPETATARWAARYFDSSPVRTAVGFGTEGEGAGEHGGEGGREGRGEHGGEGREGAGNRPSDGALRPLYNQLQLLRSEIQALSKGLSKGDG